MSKNVNFKSIGLEMRTASTQFACVALCYFLVSNLIPIQEQKEQPLFARVVLTPIARVIWLGIRFTMEWLGFVFVRNDDDIVLEIVCAEKLFAHIILIILASVTFIGLLKAAYTFDIMYRMSPMKPVTPVTPVASDATEPDAYMEVIQAEEPFDIPSRLSVDSSSIKSHKESVETSVFSKRRLPRRTLNDIFFKCCNNEGRSRSSVSSSTTGIDRASEETNEPVPEPSSPLPNPKTWKGPLFIRMVQDPRHPLLRCPPNPIQQGVRLPFESHIFSGYFVIRVRGTCNGDLDRAYFAGKKRVHQVVVQGRFKEKLRMDSVWGGQQFERQWVNLPPRWLIRAGLSTAKLLNPSLQERITDAESPFVLYPFISSPQKVNISYPGCQPDILSSSGVIEDCSLMGDVFSSRISSVRRRHFANLTRLADFYYEPEYVYTFEDYQDLFDFKTFEYNLRFTNMTICNKICGMPLEVACLKFTPSDLSNRTLIEDEFQKFDPEYLWRVQLWHYKCILSSQIE